MLEPKASTIDTVRPKSMKESEAVAAIRERVLKLSHHAKSAHVGSALSCIEILFALFQLKTSVSSTVGANTVDKIILSKGHAAMALYAVAESFGAIPGNVLDRYLEDGSKLWGHPSLLSGFTGIDWSTGSLGHGLAVATGFAYRRQFMTPGSNALVSVVLSDGECNEGTVWESALFAGHHKLKNLRVIIDYNKIQSFGTCEEVLGLEPFVDKWKSFGWQVVECDGHDTSQITQSLMSSSKTDLAPLCVIAHTIKGKGVPSLENTLKSHYQPIQESHLKEFFEVRRAK